MEAFRHNLEHALYFLFSPDSIHANDFLLSLLGVMAILFMPFMLWHRLKRAQQPLEPWDTVYLFHMVGIVLHLLLILSLGWGAWTDPLVSRFTLPLQLFFLMGVVLLLRHLREYHRLPAPGITGLILLYVVFISLPAISKGESTKRMLTGEAVAWAVDEVDRLDPDRSRLVVSHRILPYLNHGHSGMADRDWRIGVGFVPWFQQSGRFHEILFVEELSLDFTTLRWESRLADPVRGLLQEQGEIVATRAVGGKMRMRIWVVAVEREHGDQSGLEPLQLHAPEERARRFFGRGEPRDTEQRIDDPRIPEAGTPESP